MECNAFGPSKSQRYANMGARLLRLLVLNKVNTILKNFKYYVQQIVYLMFRKNLTILVKTGYLVELGHQTCVFVFI